ncbi:hypothetical protein CSQ92_15680, partial [Janthinobacterium sp. BJB446]
MLHSGLGHALAGGAGRLGGWFGRCWRGGFRWRGGGCRCGLGRFRLGNRFGFDRFHGGLVGDLLGNLGRRCRRLGCGGGGSAGQGCREGRR